MQPAPIRSVGRAVRAAARPLARLAPLAWLPPPRRSPGTAPTIGVVGFYGHGNYGDELFLDVFREHLGAEFNLRSILDPAGAGAIGRQLGAGIRDSDAILIGGGDLVIPWAVSARYWLPAYLRRPVFVAGVGVPLWHEAEPTAVARLRGFFRDPAVRFVGVRDPESATWIAEHLAPRAAIATGPDLVCALSLPPTARPAGPPILGVAVRSRSEPDDLTRVRELCERAVALGYRVRRIVLATGRVRAEDLAATERLGLPDTELVASDDLATITRAIAECTVFATMKFHGVVVATMAGVAPIALMPTTKTLNFLRGIDRPDLVSHYASPDLPGFLEQGLAPIDPAVPPRLRAASVALIDELRDALVAATSESG